MGWRQKEKEKVNHGDPFGKDEKPGRGDRDSERKDMVKKEKREIKVKDEEKEEEKDKDKEKEKEKKRERERERELLKVKEEADDEDPKLHPKRKSARRAEESNRRHAEGGVGGMGDKASPPDRKVKGRGEEVIKPLWWTLWYTLFNESVMELCERRGGIWFFLVGLHQGAKTSTGLLGSCISDCRDLIKFEVKEGDQSQG